MNASDNHANKRSHNWVVYKLNDKFMNKYTPLYKGKLYDLGCGNTSYKSYFLKFADHYIGVDWGKSIHDLKADVFADLNKPLPIESEVADTVVSLSVLEHLYEPQTLLNEAFRILKPSGNIIVQVPWQWWIHEAPHDYFRYTPYGLKYMFEKAGFKNVEVEASSGFFTTWFLKWIYFSNRFIKGPRIVRGIVRVMLTPIWYLLQSISPSLDKLDANWSAETYGYFVTAMKA